jgi:hypothetical protein
MVFLPNAGMRTGERVGTKPQLWVSTAGPVGGRALVRRWTRARRDEQHAKTAGIAVILSLFFAVLGAALLVDSRAFINPLAKSAADAREANRLGEIIYTMPDGAFCRHLSFDNTTGELAEGAIEKCAHNESKERGRTALGFAWGER